MIYKWATVRSGDDLKKVIQDNLGILIDIIQELGSLHLNII